MIGSGTQVLENLKLEPISDTQIAQFDRIYNGVDWGYYPDPWAWNRMHYDAARRILYIFDELTARRASNTQTAQLLINKGIGDGSLYADSAEPKSIGDYRSAGLPCRPVEKGAGCVEYRHKWMNSLAAIVIDPVRCPDTAKEFAEYEYERDRKTNEVLQGYPDINNHHIDASCYAMFPVWRRRGR